MRGGRKGRAGDNCFIFRCLCIGFLRGGGRGFWLLRLSVGVEGGSAAYNRLERERGRAGEQGERDEGEPSVFTPPPPSPAENAMILMNTIFFVKRRPKACRDEIVYRPFNKETHRTHGWLNYTKQFKYKNKTDKNVFFF